MRNVFDQFSQPENRLSHGLATTLSVNPKLCGDFLAWVTGIEPPKGEILIVEQQRLPGRLSDPIEMGDTGLPDMCIHSGGDWCIVFENKVAAPLTSDQLRRHRKTMEQRFENIELVAITADPRLPPLDDPIHHKTWVDIYIWLGEQVGKYPSPTDFWCRQQREYMRIFQSTELAQDYNMNTPITTFDGIPFGPDYPYSYKEAKLLIRQATGDLRQRLLDADIEVDPEHQGRSAIRGAEDSFVWDFITFRHQDGKDDFNHHPHFTLGISVQEVDPMLSLPNNMGSAYRNRLKNLGVEGFRELCAEIAGEIKKNLGDNTGYTPLIRVQQRHYRAMQIITMDGEMRFDFRVVSGDTDSKVKKQPAWLDTAFELTTNSKEANVQMQIGCVFPHKDGLLRDKEALDHIEAVWLSCKPMLDVLFGRRSP